MTDRSGWASGAHDPMPGGHLRPGTDVWCGYLHDGSICNKCGYVVPESERVEREAAIRRATAPAAQPEDVAPPRSTAASPPSLTPEQVDLWVAALSNWPDDEFPVPQFRTVCRALNEARQQIERLARERDAAQEIISELASDLEAEVNARYDGPGNVYPSQRRRYERDMEAVQRARALLNQGDG